MKPTMHLIIAQGELCQWWENEDGAGMWYPVAKSDFACPDKPTGARGEITVTLDAPAG